MNAPPRLPVDQLVGAFSEHWAKTRDLEACLTLVYDLGRFGPARSHLRASAAHRHANRARVSDNVVKRAKALRRAMPILRRFERASGLDAGTLTGRDRSKTISAIRYEAMWVLKAATKMSYPEIGMLVGGRHHSIAMIGFRKTEARFKASPDVRRRLTSFLRRCGTR